MVLNGFIDEADDDADDESLETDVVGSELIIDGTFDEDTDDELDEEESIL